jgi:hypothetical protein
MMVNMHETYISEGSFASPRRGGRCRLSGLPSLLGGGTSGPLALLSGGRLLL